ncbi:hypothetical protein P1S61_09075 [Streptomyces sp. ME08-AFT2]|uniref:hypothetical protein n=1 Tax=Streptomyces sp. ME08-AFT2 TaxID=3028683 RepID=UPI0029AB0D1D|nr:hypothetical protein [Streptomyces sp. ME08-AFT2]MDX3309245.1 hypothetical protein [Streptomyces sp. ME08-AFT2]
MTQKKSLGHIATLAGCGPRTVHQLLIQNGIRPRGRRTHPLCPDITRDWLHNEYVVNRNNLTALARQRGITIDHIILLARSWGIPIRPGGAHHNDIADLDLPQPPSPTMQKITMSRYALDRLRLMMNIPGHVSLAAAARAFYDGRDRASDNGSANSKTLSASSSSTVPPSLSHPRNADASSSAKPPRFSPSPTQPGFPKNDRPQRLASGARSSGPTGATTVRDHRYLGRRDAGSTTQW